MADEPHGFTQARARLEEIVSQVRKKDTSLEKSLDLLEEGVRLANQCTELIDHADWEAAATGSAPGEAVEGDPAAGSEGSEAQGDDNPANADVPADEEPAVGEAPESDAD